MSAIFSYKQWMEIVDRGTSGDQVYDILASWKADASALRSRVEELERENNRLASKARDILSQLEIATDLGQKRWMALNEIVEHAGMKSSDWCRRKAKEGLGLK